MEPPRRGNGHTLVGDELPALVSSTVTDRTGRSVNRWFGNNRNVVQKARQYKCRNI